MSETERDSPLLLKYLRMYQDDPGSRVFAPLAEAYRRLGFVDDAIQVCLEGLQTHPDFVGGHVALARAYFDKRDYAKVRRILGPVIQKFPDNVMAQRLFADACVELGYWDDALISYKMLLYFNPQDEETARTVKQLEQRSGGEEPEEVLESVAGGPPGFLEGHTQEAQGGRPLARRADPEKLRKLMKLQTLLNRVQEWRKSVDLERSRD